ncbi:MAG: endonuclease/exonuclease/phosphatase family protein [Fimbriimonadaceae bacterium]|nr:endonuclease/exonuclease/phosphatase family protein [Chthonomonadaceae bacterium]MCO5297654.1 endonuclease/exonuclease/phosphatase family protein [Fimbriimonadaceae bacterium]
MASEKTDSKNRIRRWALGVLLVCLLAYGLETFVAEDAWGSMWVLHLPQVLFFVPAGIVGLLAWRARDLSAVGISIGATTVALHLCAPCWRGLLPCDATRERSAAVKVVTFNVQHDHGGAERIAALLRKEAPDVVAFEEASFLGDRSSESKLVVDALPGFHWYRVANQAIASRWPLGRRWVSEFKVPTHTWAIFAEVLRDGRPDQPLLVGAVHLNPLNWDRFLSPEIGKLPEHLRTTARIRERQAEELVRELAKVDADVPVVLCGDFNGPPRGVVYSTLTRGLRDAFRQAGVGMGWTIPSVCPVTRLDYVYVRPSSTVLSARVLGNAGSDHRPLMAELIP